MVLDHDKTGHLGARKTGELLNSRFTWPGIGRDVLRHVQSCDTCLRLNKAGNVKAKLVERPTLSEPLESVAVDLVGPLPKGKRGCRFILTYMSMGTKWPEAVSLRTGSANEVAEALLSIFSRISFPLRVLNDRGSVLLSKVLKQMYQVCGVDGITTSPYRPRSPSRHSQADVG